jgi:hypothetical protein
MAETSASKNHFSGYLNVLSTMSGLLSVDSVTPPLTLCSDGMQEYYRSCMASETLDC